MFYVLILNFLFLQLVQAIGKEFEDYEKMLRE